jgi:two-component system chemotaxis response regulator CheB
MPGMDGLACLSQIMIESPRPVVMISSLTDEGAEATLEAMELGAIDFVAKPSGTVSLEIDRLRPLLIEKIRGRCQCENPPELRLTERIRHQFRGRGSVARLLADPTKGRPGKADLSPAGADWDITGGPARARRCASATAKEFPWPVMVAQTCRRRLPVLRQAA